MCRAITRSSSDTTTLGLSADKMFTAVLTATSCNQVLSGPSAALAWELAWEVGALYIHAWHSEFWPSLGSDLTNPSVELVPFTFSIVRHVQQFPYLSFVRKYSYTLASLVNNVSFGYRFRIVLIHKPSGRFPDLKFLNC